MVGGVLHARDKTCMVNFKLFQKVKLPLGILHVLHREADSREWKILGSRHMKKTLVERKLERNSSSQSKAGLAVRPVN
jgi:hypothetical protein